MPKEENGIYISHKRKGVPGALVWAILRTLIIKDAYPAPDLHKEYNSKAYIISTKQYHLREIFLDL